MMPNQLSDDKLLRAPEPLVIQFRPKSQKCINKNKIKSYEPFRCVSGPSPARSSFVVWPGRQFPVLGFASSPKIGNNGRRFFMRHL
jgi:hypothetical protein